jgi:hypothetical protein
MIKTNKKASEKVLSIWWIFVLVVIAGGIVIATSIYFSSEVNVNPIEADALANRLVMCISDSGHLNNQALDSIFDSCYLNRSLFENQSNFYFSVSIYNGDKLLKNIFAGDNSFFKDCLIAGKVATKNFPQCSVKKMRLLDGDKNLMIVVLGASNQKAEILKQVK